MRKNIVGLLLLLFILSSSSCHKKVTAGLVPLIPKLSIGEEVDYVVENPPSTPPMSEETLQTFLKVDYLEDLCQTGYDTLTPIRFTGSVFEYMHLGHLYRFDILGHQQYEFKDELKKVSYQTHSVDPIFDENENFILSDNTNYYYLTSNVREKIEDFLVCKNISTLKEIWKCKIPRDDLPYQQKIVQTKKHIFVFSRNSLTMYCISKESGQIRWTFNAGNRILYISLPDVNHSNNGVMRSSFIHIIHQFDNYLVACIHSYDTRAKTNNPYIFDRPLYKEILLTDDGEMIRELTDVASYAYHQNLYLYSDAKEYGVKRIIDGKILWKTKISNPLYKEEKYEEHVIRIGDEKFQLCNSFLVKIGKKANLTTLTLLNYETGSAVWKKTLEITGYHFIEFKDLLYIIGSDVEYKPETPDPDLFLITIDPKKTAEKITPINLKGSDHDIERFIYNSPRFAAINGLTYLFFNNGIIIMEPSRATYFSYISLIDPLFRNYWTIPDYWDVSIRTANQSILVVFTNSGNNGPGGGYLVFKIAKQGK
jgi:outer membrane protein assembly factor BamB